MSKALPARIMKLQISPNFDSASLWPLYRCTGLSVFNPSERPPPKDFLTLVGANYTAPTVSIVGSADTISVTATELIAMGDRFAVLRAVGSGRKVVVKISLGSGSFSDLQTEAKNYMKLADLQGTGIPFCHGLFHSLEKFKGNLRGFLVLEDCGDHPTGDRYFSALRHEQKLKVLSIVGDIDRKGFEISTDEFCKDNVVTQNNEFRVISLANLTAHTCGWNGDWRADSNDPTRAEFDCNVLFGHAVLMGFWYPDHVLLLFLDLTQLRRIGSAYTWATDLPDQEACDILLEGQTNVALSRSWNWMKLLEWLREVKERIDDGESPHSLKKTIPELPLNSERAEELDYPLPEPESDDDSLDGDESDESD